MSAAEKPDRDDHPKVPWRFLAGLLAGVLIMVWITFFDATWSDAATREASPHVAASNARAASADAPSVTRMPARDEYSRAWRNAFVNHRIGNSRGIVVPAHTRRLIRQWYARNTAAGRTSAGWDDWWEAPLDAAKCMTVRFTNGGPQYDCRDHQANVTALSDATWRVSVKCGGSAILGFFFDRRTGGRGVWGMGSGATVCLWEHFWDALRG